MMLMTMTIPKAMNMMQMLSCRWKGNQRSEHYLRPPRSSKPRPRLCGTRTAGCFLQRAKTTSSVWSVGRRCWTSNPAMFTEFGGQWIIHTASSFISIKKYITFPPGWQKMHSPQRVGGWKLAESEGENNAPWNCHDYRKREFLGCGGLTRVCKRLLEQKKELVVRTSLHNE